MRRLIIKNIYYGVLVVVVFVIQTTANFILTHHAFLSLQVNPNWAIVLTSAFCLIDGGILTRILDHEPPKSFEVFLYGGWFLAIALNIFVILISLTHIQFFPILVITVVFLWLVRFVTGTTIFSFGKNMFNPSKI